MALSSHSTELVCIRRLRLLNYRNFVQCALDFSARHVIFTGHNGAGKTNLLEAMSLLSPGRGLRRAAYADMCALNAKVDMPFSPISDASSSRLQTGQGFVIHARLHANSYDQVDVGISTDMGGGGRKVRVNGDAVPAEHLTDYVNIGWLTPAMDSLFTGPAGDRRRFMDRLVLALDSSHARRVVDYEKLMRSRNRLLSEGQCNTSWLTAIEKQMAELATAIAAARLDLVRLLRDMTAQLSHDSPFPRADFYIEGVLERDLLRQSAVDVEHDYIGRLQQARSADRAAGRTLEGPHRSDLQVFYADKQMAASSSSTGEQKILLTSIVVSHAQLIAQTTDMAPILLFDEVAAHLDSRRRAALFEVLDALGGQTFMTGTDHFLYDSLAKQAEFFEIQEGAVLAR